MKKLISALLALLLMLSVTVMAETAGEGSTEVTAEVTEEVIFVEGSMQNPCLFGMEHVFETQVDRGGFSPLEEKEGDYVTLTVAIRVLRSMTPEYYEQKYSQTYNLKGTEAGIKLELTFRQAEGFSALIPQDAVLIRVADAEGNIIDGFQMMSDEIGGHNKVEAQPGEPCTLYKRYTYDEAAPAKYLVVTTYVDGRANDIYIALENPVKYDALEAGMISGEVRALQKQLVQLGYLEGGVDSAFGAMTTQAVKNAQKDFGLDQTGIADDLFQRYLYDR